MPERLKREDVVDASYLNAMEHDRRYPPSNHLIDQLAEILGVPADLLYFQAKRLPANIKRDVDNERVEMAYQAFQQGAERLQDRQQKEMKPLRDPLGRPIQRLCFKTEVLDARREGIIKGFMERRSGGFRLPIPTDVPS